MRYTQRISMLKSKLESRAEQIKSILRDYQADGVTNYEIERCIRTLNGLHQNDRYLNGDRKINSAAIMLPSNLPLYSLFVFVLVPSILSKQVYVRPNSILQEHNIISRIYDELELDLLFPEVIVVNKDHEGFEIYIKEADLVVFTGKPSHAEKFLPGMKKDSVLVINGAGHNPLVITASADVDAAVDGALLVKGFNGGQDCAGPDAILVHQDIANEFLGKFDAGFSALKTGTFQNSSTIIGPIHRFSELQRLAGILNSNQKDILSGGMIDYKNSIIHPTTIVRGIERYPNFKEIYGPIAFIHPYKSDADLSHYFQDMDGQYNGNRMYVSVYGHSDYVSSRDDRIHPGRPGNVGIVLHNQTIHDVEIGYDPYGGYSMGASGVIKKTAKGILRTAMPILLPEIIFEYLINNKELPSAKENVVNDSLITSIKKVSEISPIIENFQLIAKEAFGDNLLFAFIFGSAAKGNLKLGKDDLDTFICTKVSNPDQLKLYHLRLNELHKKYNLKPDETYPSEIMTLDRLQITIQSAAQFNVDIQEPITGDSYDNLFWVHALTDKKIGFLGDGRLMSYLIKQSQTNIPRWRNQIMSQLEKVEALPVYLNVRFIGLSKNEVIAKLNQYPHHLIIHLGLNYEDSVIAASPLTPAQLSLAEPSTTNSVELPVTIFANSDSESSGSSAMTIQIEDKMSGVRNKNRFHKEAPSSHIQLQLQELTHVLTDEKQYPH